MNYLAEIEQHRAIENALDNIRKKIREAIHLVYKPGQHADSQEETLDRAIRMLLGVGAEISVLEKNRNMYEVEWGEVATMEKDCAMLLNDFERLHEARVSRSYT